MCIYSHFLHRQAHDWLNSTVVFPDENWEFLDERSRLKLELYAQVDRLVNNLRAVGIDVDT